MSSKPAFPYPLPLEALEDFCHPVAGSVFAKPRKHEGETLVGNTHLALRIRKGTWLDSEISAAEESAEFVRRMGGLDWNAPFESPEWRYLADVKARLFPKGSAPVGLWLEGKTGPSPVVMVAGRFRARLSVLQLVARLPRVEVYTGAADPTKPLWLRFSGGYGLIARHAALDVTPPSFSIFEPQRHHETGEVLRRPPKAFQGLKPSGSPWPPVDTSDLPEPEPAD